MLALMFLQYKSDSRAMFILLMLMGIIPFSFHHDLVRIIFFPLYFGYAYFFFSIWCVYSYILESKQPIDFKSVDLRIFKTPAKIWLFLFLIIMFYPYMGFLLLSEGGLDRHKFLMLHLPFFFTFLLYGIGKAYVYMRLSAEVMRVNDSIDMKNLDNYYKDIRNIFMLKVLK